MPTPWYLLPKVPVSSSLVPLTHVPEHHKTKGEKNPNSPALGLDLGRWGTGFGGFGFPYFFPPELPVGETAQPLRRDEKEKII